MWENSYKIICDDVRVLQIYTKSEIIVDIFSSSKRVHFIHDGT